MSVARTALAAAALLVLPTVALAQHGAPKPPGLAHYDVFADGGTLHLILGERTPAGMVLKYRQSGDGGATWTTAVPVTGDGDTVFGPHPGETAQVAAHDGHLVAIWTQADGENGRGGTVASAVSDDGGRTWKRAATPANDGSKRYHALVELGAGAAGFHAVWLHGDGGDGVSTVNYAHSADGTLTALWARAIDGGSVIERATSKDGKAWATAEAVSSAKARATQPRVIANGNRLATFWVEREGDTPAALVVNGTRVAP